MHSWKYRSTIVTAERMMKKILPIFLALLLSTIALAQADQIKTGTGLGVEKVRLALPDFKPVSGDAQTANLNKTFNDTLWNDLDSSGIIEMVSKSFYPLDTPGAPPGVNPEAWANDPTKAGMLAFGNLDAAQQDIVVQGWLVDVKNPGTAPILAKQYREKASEDNARKIAHEFADEIILRLGGGLPGIAESKIFFISKRTGHKEVWEMDYDGNNQHALTHLGSIALSPRVSPDNSRVAFTSFARGGVDIAMYSLDLGRLVTFPHFGGTNLSPAWASDGSKIAFSSSRTGDPEIYIVDADGRNLKRITAFKGPDVSPVWNPKTNAQIAWVSGRTGLPQIYTMDSDGTNVQRMTDQGYAVSPSWSPNGQFLAFSWIRHYGPGAPGNQDIYVMDMASRKFVQLTTDAGRNDFPSWSPDGRHLVFQSDRKGRWQIWTMLADGTQQKPITSSGENTQPNWSFK
jgi:TolB protein